MVSYNHASNHFILYETDNIPNYESHRYGCSKRLLSLRTFAVTHNQQKSRIECWNTQYGKCKMTNG